MKKVIFGCLICFCLGYFTNNFISIFDLSPITSAHADTEDAEVLDVEALLQDLEFRLAVKEIVEDCIVEDNRITC